MCRMNTTRETDPVDVGWPGYEPGHVSDVHDPDRVVSSRQLGDSSLAGLWPVRSGDERRGLDP